jgi:predicted protein tyrosine phosphatase
MSCVIVSPLTNLAQTAVHHGARSMITLLARDQKFHRPGLIAADRHLVLGVNDIVHDSTMLVAPGADHVKAILDFARRWDRSSPLLVHCWMGVSRSPAAALLIALALEPDQDEDALARRLRAAAPFATPNARLIDIGDALLGRQGRLVDAVQTIGRGRDTFEGTPFSLSLRPGDPQAAEVPRV